MNYDDVAADYDRRYELREYRGVRETLFGVIGRVNGLGNGAAHVLEVGCGTGRWLAELERSGCRVAGIDPSAGMLQRASERVRGDLQRGTAEKLPWPEGVFDAVICVNALHHFTSPESALLEAYRVLRPGGGFVSIGLDPHAAAGRWYVYEFFSKTLARDLERFPAQRQRTEWLAAAGFRHVSVRVAERLHYQYTLDEALDQGILKRSFTSQLTEISESEYHEGMDKIREAAERNPSFRLSVDLELYSTEAWKPV